jgi:hypothetical protein
MLKRLILIFKDLREIYKDIKQKKIKIIKLSKVGFIIFVVLKNSNF